MEQESLCKRHLCVGNALLRVDDAAGAKSAPHIEDASKVAWLRGESLEPDAMNHDASADGDANADEDFVLTDYDGDIVKQEPVLDSIQDMSIKLRRKGTRG